MATINPLTRKYKEFSVEDTPLKSIVSFKTDEEAEKFDRTLRSCHQLKGSICIGILKRIVVTATRTYGPNCYLYSLKDEIKSPWLFVKERLFKQETEEVPVQTPPKKAKLEQKSLFNPSNRQSRPSVRFRWVRTQH